MWRKHGRVFLAAGLLKLVHDCVMFLGPFILQQLLIFLERGGSACKKQFEICLPVIHILKR